MRAVVLCGGFGKRLGELTREVPKPLLEVGGKPFVGYVLDRLMAGGVTQACLAVSFQWQKFRPVLGDQWNDLRLSYSVESDPLGTGGAVRQALLQMAWPDALIVNGDTLVDVNLYEIQKMAHTRRADAIVALKPVDASARFGKVTVGRDLRIHSFSEKSFLGPGLINAGVYWLRAQALDRVRGRVFSLEREFIANHVKDLNIYGLITSGYFVDMGIPEDLERVRREFE
jgi:D-glycero-alpha-D-manno-heptose 1-phosphate guanylyltransferase